MAQVRGTVGTGKVIADRLRIDMDDTIHMLDPNATPFTLLLQKIGSENSMQTEFKWMEDDYVPFKTTLSALDGGGAATATWDVTDPTIFRVNDVVTVPSVSDLTYLVTAVDDTALTIDVLAIGGGNCDAVAQDDIVLRIGDAFPEGTNKRSILTTQEAVLENYCQIFKYTFGVTRTAKKAKTYGGDLLSTQRKKAGIEFAIEKEKSFWWGKKYKYTDTTSGQPIRFMDGLLSFITTNVDDILGAALTKEAFDGWLAKVFKHGDPIRYVFCSESLINFISDLSADKLQTKIGEKTFGIAITEYITPAGKKCYLINNNRVFEDAPYDNFAVALDLAQIKRRVYRPVFLETNVQENGEDSELDQYISEESLKVKLEQMHGVLKNFVIS